MINIDSRLTNFTETGNDNLREIDMSTVSRVNFPDDWIRCEPGDVLAIAVKTVNNTTDAFVALNWQEQ